MPGGGGPARATHEADRERVLLLRLIPKESAVGQFVALNQRIEELGQGNPAAEAGRGRSPGAWRAAAGDAPVHRRCRHHDRPGRPGRDDEPGRRAADGLDADEATGLPLEAVFSIVNEATRQVVENPAQRALREGVVVGLANHTVLVARDGTERPIDDSAAPIRNGRGPVVGACWSSGT